MSPAKKKKRHLGTYFTVGVAVLLALYVYFIEKPDRLPKNAISMYNVETEDIRKVEVINLQTNESLTLEKQGKDWRMVKPKLYEIEKSDVEGLVNNLADLRIERKVRENCTDLVPYGLEKPAHRISFTAGKKTQEVLVGNKNPTQVSYYIKEGSKNDVYTAFAYSVEYLIKDVKALRKKNLFDLETDKVTGVTIKLDKKEIVLVKDASNNWIIEPYKFAAEKTTVIDLIEKLKNLRVADYFEDEPATLVKYGIERPRVSVIVSRGAGLDPVSLFVGKKVKDKEEDYVKSSDGLAVYSVDKSFAAGFDKTYNDYRDRKIFNFKASDISGVLIEKDGKKLANAIKDRFGKFKIEEPVSKLADVQFVDLLNYASTLSAEKFVDDSGKRFEKYGLKSPAVSITFFEQTGNEKKIKAKLMLGRLEKNEYNVRIEGNDTVFAVSRTIADKLAVIDNFVKEKTK